MGLGLGLANPNPNPSLNPNPNPLHLRDVVFEEGTDAVGGCADQLLGVGLRR